MKFEGELLNGRWRLGPRMGAGAQARTYLAFDEKGKEGRVIIKRYHLSRDGGGWKRFDLFEREVRVLKQLRHPRIPRFLDFFESGDGTLNLVIEKMPGATLRAFARKVRFTDYDLRDILAQSLEILDYLHNLRPPVIHRDLKPSNLVRSADGKISLVDFGGVRDALRVDGGSTVVGTFGYMAPEQLHGEASAATDIYALGATVVSLAGGVPPEDVPRRGLRMDLKKHLAHVDDRLVAVLEAMTEPDPAARPRSAREVSRLLAAPAPRLLAGEPAASALPARGGGFPDDIERGLAQVPAPIQQILRIVVLLAAIGGHVGLALLRWVLAPVVFFLVGAVAGTEGRAQIADSRKQLEHALDEGIDDCRTLRHRALGRGENGRRALPPRR